MNLTTVRPTIEDDAKRHTGASDLRVGCLQVEGPGRGAGAP